MTHSFLPHPDIRVIGLDLDGTLFNEQKIITPRTLCAIEAAAKKGVCVLPATGRVFAGLPQSLLCVPGIRYALTSNGASVVDLSTQKPIVSHPLPRAAAKAILDAMSQFDGICDLFIRGKGYTPGVTYEKIPAYANPSICAHIQTFDHSFATAEEMLNAFPDDVEKVSAMFCSPAERDAAWAAVSAACPCDISASYSNNIEVSDVGVTKGAALLALAEKLGFTADNIMACGDSGNDLAMIRAAGLGVAMANSSPEVLAAADYVTLSNEEDGVAAAIEKFVL